MTRARKLASLLLVLAVASLAGIKLWERNAKTLEDSLPQGPAVILFRGDNSPGCRAIDRLVEEAAQGYRGRIAVVQTDWSPDAPLIERYRVLFLPTVVFIDARGIEIGRIVGESPAVQAQLKQALTQFEQAFR